MRREFCWKTVTRRRERKRLAKKKFNMNLRYILRELDGPDPGWCPMLDFDTSRVKPSASAVRQLV